VVQDTLNAGSAENVEQMEHALDTIYRQHSQGYQHDYEADFQILDVDMSGQPAGPKPRLPPRGTLPSSATAADANWAAYWPAATKKWWRIGSLMARRN
jgi:hypothetical protein